MMTKVWIMVAAVESGQLLLTLFPLVKGGFSRVLNIVGLCSGFANYMFPSGIYGCIYGFIRFWGDSLLVLGAGFLAGSLSPYPPHPSASSCRQNQKPCRMSSAKRT
jgi:hypothetical protein